MGVNSSQDRRTTAKRLPGVVLSEDVMMPGLKGARYDMMPATAKETGSRIKEKSPFWLTSSDEETDGEYTEKMRARVEQGEYTNKEANEVGGTKTKSISRKEPSPRERICENRPTSRKENLG